MRKFGMSRDYNPGTDPPHNENTMDQIDLLLVLAQVGVTLAGFASLATVVGQATSTDHPEVNAIRLRGLLSVSLSVMFLALIASGLLKVENLAVDLAWRGAAALGFVVALFVGFGVLKRDRKRRKLPGYNKLTMTTNFTILGVVVVALGCAASGVLQTYVGSAFVGALILMLVGASTAFILVVTSFLETRKFEQR